MANKSAITFYGGTGTVTGANFLLETDGRKFLIDCGMFQGTPEADARNRESFAYDPKEIEILFVTHAHLDHIGRIPFLVKEGFKGKIFSTPPTKELTALMLEDTVNLLDQEARSKGVLPLYGRAEMLEALNLWQTFDYHETKELGNGLGVTPKDSGHILGSAIYEFTKNGKKVAFTGDLGNSPTALLKDTEPLKGVNYLVTESVYGDRNHESRDERVGKLKQAIEVTSARGGTLVIPAFSMERTQVLIYEINKMVESGQLKPLPVYLDSPLAIRVTEVYRHSQENFNDDVKKAISMGDEIFKFPLLKLIRTAEESSAIKRHDGAKVIIAGSGMSMGGRVRMHETDYLPGANNMILLVGYQSVGTLGRKLQNGDKAVEIDGEMIPVQAEIREINGFSSHKDSEHLLEFVSETAPSLEKVFVVMGEPKAGMFLAQRIRDYLNVEAVYPEVNQRVEINF